MSLIFAFVLGAILGYYLSLFLPKWKNYRYGRGFKPVLLKPYRAKAKNDE